MKKWMLYFSLFIITVSLFFSFTIEVLDHKILFSSDVYKYGEMVAKVTQRSLEEKLNKNFDNAFMKVQNTLHFYAQEKKKNYEKLNFILQNIANESFMIRNIFVNTVKEKSECAPSLKKINYSRIYSFCQEIEHYHVVFNIDLNLMSKMVNETYARQNDGNFILQKILFFDREILYMNIDKGLVIEHNSIIQELKDLLQKGRNFDLTIEGQRIYVFPIHLFENRLKHFYLFLGLAPSNLPVSNVMIIAIALMLIVSLFFLGVGIYFIRQYCKSAPLMVKNSYEKSKKENKEYVPIKYPEIQELMTVINDNEKSKTNYPVIVNELQKRFLMIDNTFVCQKNEDKKSITVNCITKDGQIHIFNVNFSQFVFPTLIPKTYQSFYIYQDAGKTTPVKEFLNSSMLNIASIEGFICVSLKDWDFFVIHTTSQQIEEDTSFQIYQDTFNLFKEYE